KEDLSQRSQSNDSVLSGTSLCISAKSSRGARGGVRRRRIATGRELDTLEALPPEYFDSQALGIRLNKATRIGINAKAL
ncbi:MAG: hypothetical protein ACM335_12815, partial [Deltaproteobacteria bacterium]